MVLRHPRVYEAGRGLTLPHRTIVVPHDWQAVKVAYTGMGNDVRVVVATDTPKQAKAAVRRQLRLLEAGKTLLLHVRDQPGPVGRKQAYELLKRQGISLSGDELSFVLAELISTERVGKNWHLSAVGRQWLKALELLD